MIDISALSAQVGDTVTFAMLNALGLRHGRSATRPKALHDWLASHDAESRDHYFSGEGLLEPNLVNERHLVWNSRRPSGFTQNDRARADLYLCDAGWKAPTVLMLHALMSASDVGYRIWASKFNRMGWNACFVHLPFHYSRRPKGYWNGELAITCDVIRTGEGLRQAVVDVRDLMAICRANGGERFGLWATSYGGWIGGLLLSVEADFNFAVLMEPIVDVDHAVWVSPAGGALRFYLKRMGLTREDYAPMLPWISPRHGRPLPPGHLLYLAAGTHDRVAEASDIREVADGWGAHYCEYPQGHIGYSLMPGMFRRLCEDGHLVERGLAPSWAEGEMPSG